MNVSLVHMLLANNAASVNLKRARLSRDEIAETLALRVRMYSSYLQTLEANAVMLAEELDRVGVKERS